MAGFVSTNAYLSVGGVDLSSRVKSVEVTWEAEQVDDTAMGDTVRSNLNGLKNLSVSASLQQDTATGSTDATLFPLVGTAVAVVVKPVNATTSATNPQYSSTLNLVSYPLAFGIGEEAMTNVTFAPTGVALTRAVS